MSLLLIQGISKSFDNNQALKQVSFEVETGEIVALLGPSGCGKSTLLSIIAGLVTPDSGDVCWSGKKITDLPPHLRGFGLMFQDFALFPHMHVYANIAFGLKMSHMPPVVIEQRVKEMLALVGLPDISNRDVNSLSGGEQQRVALARAFAPRPNLLMLDEPLGSLDRNLRERLMVDLQNILHQLKQTAIYVTHDQEEAFAVADRIILMNSGRIEQIGTPQEIYRDPASAFVARFLEMANIIPAEIRHQNGKYNANTFLGAIPVPPSQVGSAQLLIRPDKAQLNDEGSIVIRGTYSGVSFRGSWQRLTVLVGQTPLYFDFSSGISLPATGSEIAISFEPLQAVKVFPEDHSA